MLLITLFGVADLRVIVPFCAVALGGGFDVVLVVFGGELFGRLSFVLV